MNLQASISCKDLATSAPSFRKGVASSQAITSQLMAVLAFALATTVAVSLLVPELVLALWRRCCWSILLGLCVGRLVFVLVPLLPKQKNGFFLAAQIRTV